MECIPQLESQLEKDVVSNYPELDYVDPDIIEKFVTKYGPHPSWDWPIGAMASAVNIQLIRSINALARQMYLN